MLQHSFAIVSAMWYVSIFFCVYYMLPYLKVNGAENREWKKNSNENYEWVWVRGKCTTEQYQIPISLFWIDSIYSYFSLFYGNENNNRMTNAKIFFIFEGYMLQWNIMESIQEILFNCSDVNFWFPTSWWLRFLLDFWELVVWHKWVLGADFWTCFRISSRLEAGLGSIISGTTVSSDFLLIIWRHREILFARCMVMG